MFNFIQTLAWFILAAFWLGLSYHFQITLQPTLPLIPLLGCIMALGCACRSGLYLGDLLCQLDNN